MPSSPGDRSSPLPWTPLGGTLDLPDLEAATPELGVIEDEEENESTPVEAKAMAVDEDSPLQRLPKSNSSYDLRSRAQTPKTSDGKLGLSRGSSSLLLIEPEKMADVRNTQSSSTASPLPPPFSQSLSDTLTGIITTLTEFTARFPVFRQGTIRIFCTFKWQAQSPSGWYAQVVKS